MTQTDTGRGLYRQDKKVRKFLRAVNRVTQRRVEVCLRRQEKHEEITTDIRKATDVGGQVSYMCRQEKGRTLYKR